MALYAMGDFHLSFAVNKPMDVFGREWKNHVRKIEKYWKKYVKETDTAVITGDHSWGRNLEKTRKLNSLYEGRLSFLQNNFYTYEDYALVGTKGYCYEGKDTYEHFEKIRDRELARLQESFEAAASAGCRKFLMFLHYPPTSIGETESGFTRMARKYGAEQVVYSHCHGKARYDDSFHGEVGGIIYHLVSSDYLRFRPERIL